MSNYLNQIESDLYKLNSITNGSGEVVEMVAEIKEKYEKAKAWDKLSESIRECNKEIEVKDGLNALFRTSKKGQIVQRHIDCFESGEPFAKK